jgi:hypothetical protein
VIARCPAAESVPIHHARRLAPQLVVAPADDAAPAAATAHHLKLATVLLSLRPLVHLLHRALAIAPLLGLGLGLCRLQTAMAKDLRAAPTTVVLCPHELARRV